MKELKHWQDLMNALLGAVLIHLAERNHNPFSDRQLEFPDQILPAIPHLCRQGLVTGGSAAHRGRDEAVLQLQPIVQAYRNGLICKSKFV